MILPRGWESGQAERRSGARGRSGRRKEGQRLKSMKTRSVMAGEGGSPATAGRGIGRVAAAAAAVEERRRDRRRMVLGLGFEGRGRSGGREAMEEEWMVTL